jgi:hypothetical protein
MGGADLAASAKTVWPNTNSAFYAVSTLRARGNGPNGRSYDAWPSISIAGNTLSFSMADLAVGTWNFEFYAYNATNNLIARATAAATISAPGPNAISADLEMVTDSGGVFSLNLAWSDDFNAGRVDVVFDRRLPAAASHTISFNPPFTIGTDSRSLSLSEPLDAGLYDLTIRLYDNPPKATPAWGMVESLYIAPGQTSALSVPTGAPAAYLSLTDIPAPPILQDPALASGVVMDGTNLLLDLVTADPNAVIVYTVDVVTDPGYDFNLSAPTGNSYVLPRSVPPAFDPLVLDQALDTYGGQPDDNTILLRIRAVNRWGSSECYYRSFWISDAIFVDPLAAPGPGIQADPMRSIDAAISRASSLLAYYGGPIGLRLAKGFHTLNNADLPDGVNLSGGYDRSTWVQDLATQASAYQPELINCSVIQGAGSGGSSVDNPLATLRLGFTGGGMGNSLDHLLVAAPKTGNFLGGIAASNRGGTLSALNSVAIVGGGGAANAAIGLSAVNNSPISASGCSIRVGQNVGIGVDVYGIRSIDSALTLNNGEVRNGAGGDENFGVYFRNSNMTQQLRIIGTAPILAGDGAASGSYGVRIASGNAEIRDFAVISAGSSAVQTRSIGIELDTQYVPGAAAQLLVQNQVSVYGGDANPSLTAAIGAGLFVGDSSPIQVDIENSSIYSGMSGYFQYAAYMHYPQAYVGPAGPAISLRSVNLIARGGSGVNSSTGLAIATAGPTGLARPVLVERCRIYGGDSSNDSRGFDYYGQSPADEDIVLRNNIIDAGNGGMQSRGLMIGRSAAAAGQGILALNNTVICRGLSLIGEAVNLSDNLSLDMRNNILIAEGGSTSISIVNQSAGASIATGFFYNAMFSESGVLYYRGGMDESASVSPPASSTNIVQGFVTNLFTDAMPTSFGDFAAFTAELRTPDPYGIFNKGTNLAGLPDWGFSDDFDSPAGTRTAPWSIGAQERN